jgi:hypothetical protein
VDAHLEPLSVGQLEEGRILPAAVPAIVPSLPEGGDEVLQGVTPIDVDQDKRCGSYTRSRG